MKVIRTQFDGTRILLPENDRPRQPGEVIVIFEEEDSRYSDRFPEAAQEAAFAKVWDNPDDEIYDRL